VTGGQGAVEVGKEVVEHIVWMAVDAFGANFELDGVRLVGSEAGPPRQRK